MVHTGVLGESDTTAAWKLFDEFLKVHRLQHMEPVLRRILPGRMQLDIPLLPLDGRPCIHRPVIKQKRMST